MQSWSAEFESAVRENLLSAEPGRALRETTSLADLHMDSLSVMSLVTSLEVSFRTTLPPDALARGFETTLGELWSHCGTPGSVAASG
jgi:acyl carrier protein